jgi:hypothetical protein
MSFETPTNKNRKRKPLEALEPVVSSTVAESRPRDTRTRRVSFEAQSSVSSTHTTAPTPGNHPIVASIAFASVSRGNIAAPDDRKRKKTEAPEPVVSSTFDETRHRDTRTRRVSFEAPSSVSSTHITSPSPGNHPFVASIASVSRGNIAAPDDSKRKKIEAPEPVVSSTFDESSLRGFRPRRVSLIAQPRVSSTHAIAPTPGNHSIVACIAPFSRGTVAVPYGSMKGIANMMQALTCSNEAAVDLALDTLYRYSKRGFDSQSWAKIATVGGCFGLVQLMQKSLEMAITTIPLRNQPNDFRWRVATGRLSKAFIIISNMTHGCRRSMNGINSNGGVEVLVKVLKTFRKHHPWLQLRACNALCNLTACPIGRKRADEAGAIEVLLTTIKSYPGNKDIFLYGCRALTNMCASSFARTKELIDLGGITTWPDDPEARAVAKGLLDVMAEGVHQLLTKC